MSHRDIRAAKIAVLIVAVVAVLALVSSVVDSQNAASNQTIEELSR